MNVNGKVLPENRIVIGFGSANQKFVETIELINSLLTKLEKWNYVLHNVISYDGVAMLLESDFELEFSKPWGSADDWSRSDDAHVGELIDLHAGENEVVDLIVDVRDLYLFFSG